VTTDGDLVNKSLVVVIGLLLTVIGAMVGHVTTRAAMLEDTNAQIREFQRQYVPRSELESRLETMDVKLEAIRTILEEQRNG